MTVLREMWWRSLWAFAWNQWFLVKIVFKLRYKNISFHSEEALQHYGRLMAISIYLTLKSNSKIGFDRHSDQKLCIFCPVPKWASFEYHDILLNCFVTMLRWNDGHTLEKDIRTSIHLSVLPNTTHKQLKLMLRPISRYFRSSKT